MGMPKDERVQLLKAEFWKFSEPETNVFSQSLGLDTLQYTLHIIYLFSTWLELPSALNVIIVMIFHLFGARPRRGRNTILRNTGRQ